MKKYIVLISVFVFMGIFVYMLVKRSEQKIVVFYIHPNAERSCALTIEGIDTLSKKIGTVERKYVCSDDFKYICDNIRKTSVRKNDIYEPRMIIETASLTFYIDSQFDAYDKNFDSISIPPRAIYLIRKYSGYYNEVDYDDLKYIKDIRMFGVPSNYHHQEITIEERRKPKNALKFKTYINKCLFR